jgi:hypothetical protein
VTGPRTARHQPADPSPAGAEPGAGTRPGRAGGQRDPHNVTRLRPPLRIAESPQDGGASARLAETHAELARLHRDYHTALRDGLRARERAEIAAAFDNSDALQRRILATLRRAHELERELAEPATAEIHELPAPAGRGELAAAPDDAT